MSFNTAVWLMCMDCKQFLSCPSHTLNNRELTRPGCEGPVRAAHTANCSYCILELLSCDQLRLPQQPRSGVRTDALFPINRFRFPPVLHRSSSCQLPFHYTPIFIQCITLTGWTFLASSWKLSGNNHWLCEIAFAMCLLDWYWCLRGLWVCL